MLSHAVEHQEEGATTTTTNPWPLVLPTFVLDQIRPEKDQASLFLDWSSEASKDDLGWMYKILDEKISINSINGTNTPRLIWPADSF